MYVLIIHDAFHEEKHELMHTYGLETEDLRAQLRCVYVLCVYVCIYVFMHACMYVLIIGDAFCNEKHELIRRHDKETEDLRAQLRCVSHVMCICMYVYMYACMC
jgi:hypothetical protein